MFFAQLIASHKGAQPRGITAVCSAHPWVLRAALRRAGPVLIESTCNQVNQYGGYTGQTPAQFVGYLKRLAAEAGFPAGQLLLGGDHLGPSVRAGEQAESAMQKAEELVRACVAAGYQKIHLDASMHLGGDDPSRPLDVELAAQRAARLAQAAEQAGVSAGGMPPWYVIGTEVPPPGGAAQHEQKVQVTTPEAVRQTIEATRQAFTQFGLQAAWERVMAVVVQPGVEFGDDFVLDYQPALARKLSRFIETTPYVYEAHSTDYQTRQSLRRLVRDHFAILKVGPALTFAFREAVFVLAAIEAELFPAEERSNIVQVIESAMLAQPAYWQKYYPGPPAEQAFKRKFSLSDRLRYYWSQPVVQSAFERLLHNLAQKPIPWSLLSQYAPGQVRQIREGRLENTPRALLLDRITDVLDDYAAAAGSLEKRG
jgi:D-tagatose-1,6-bisphosphate aldolase subunit GatZ/KbaZ